MTGQSDGRIFRDAGSSAELEEKCYLIESPLAERRIESRRYEFREDRGQTEAFSTAQRSARRHIAKIEIDLCNAVSVIE